MKGLSAGALLVIPVSGSERPLKGTTGLLDWRLCGLLSRLIIQGKISGADGEFTLIPVRYHHGSRNLLCVGTGKRTAADGSARRAERIREKVSKLGFSEVYFIDGFCGAKELASKFHGLKTGWIT
ncbi:MAG: hypothetical protein HYW49_12450 [Deltaproteobacteria bacterium]|nr:hypothetical protein [Deltaproteobacteria bacterium]